MKLCCLHVPNSSTYFILGNRNRVHPIFQILLPLGVVSCPLLLSHPSISPFTSSLSFSISFFTLAGLCFQMFPHVLPGHPVHTSHHIVLKFAVCVLDLSSLPTGVVSHLCLVLSTPKAVNEYAWTEPNCLNHICKGCMYLQKWHLFLHQLTHTIEKSDVSLDS